MKSIGIGRHCQAGSDGRILEQIRRAEKPFTTWILNSVTLTPALSPITVNAPSSELGKGATFNIYLFANPD